MGFFDEIYAGFFGRYSPLWDKPEREREIIDIEYEDLSDQIESNHQLPCDTKNIQPPTLLAKNYVDSNNK